MIRSCCSAASFVLSTRVSQRSLSSVNLLLLLWAVGLNCCDLKQTLAGGQAHKHTRSQAGRRSFDCQTFVGLFRWWTKLIIMISRWTFLISMCAPEVSSQMVDLFMSQLGPHPLPPLPFFIFQCLQNKVCPTANVCCQQLAVQLQAIGFQTFTSYLALRIGAYRVGFSWVFLKCSYCLWVVVITISQLAVQIQISIAAACSSSLTRTIFRIRRFKVRSHRLINSFVKTFTCFES